MFTGSNHGFEPIYRDAATNLGKAIASRDFTLVYGGASVGLMGCIADTVLHEGGEVIGVLPRSLADLEIAHSSLTKLVITDSMHSRKTVMADLADAFVAMPGGLGTLEELFEVWTWTQLGIHSKPIGMLNVQGYFDSLLKFLDETVAAGFVTPKHRNLAISISDPDALLTGLLDIDVSLESKLIGDSDK